MTHARVRLFSLLPSNGQAVKRGQKSQITKVKLKFPSMRERRAREAFIERIRDSGAKLEQLHTGLAQDQAEQLPLESSPLSYETLGLTRGLALDNCTNESYAGDQFDQINMEGSEYVAAESI